MLRTILNQWQPFLVLGSLAGFWIWESASPFFLSRNRIKHALRNLVIAGLNAVVLGYVFAGLTLVVAETAEANGLGILRLLGISGFPLLIVAVVGLDLWSYWWHRMNHRFPLLWRFHRMHHSDPTMDVTTATRFHVGEIAISSVTRLLLVPLLGIPLDAILLYDLAQLPVLCFHHANIGLPGSVDRVFRALIVTPFMHKVHHSRLRSETNSNFSSLLSLWDRIFGSYVVVGNPRGIRFGLEGFDGEDRQSVGGLLKTPLN